MDKFGIFKLLNSFFNFYQENKNTNAENTSPIDGLTESFFGIGNKPNKEKPKQEQALTPPLPLQNDMINTMTSHDAFLRRVQQKNSIKSK